MKFFSSAFLFFTLLTSISHAFINIESLRQSDDKGFLGSLGLKLNGAAGNTEKFSSSFGSNNIYRSGKNEVLGLLNYTYSEVSGDKNIHRGQVHLRYSRSLRQRLASEIFTQIEFDDFKSLKYRKLLGLGLRHISLNTSSHKIASGLGVFYESEEFDDLTKFTLYRMNLYLSYKGKLNENSELTFVNYLQPAVEDLGNIRFKSHLRLGFKVTNNMSFTTELRYSFDSNLEEPIKKGDLVYLTGLNIKY